MILASYVILLALSALLAMFAFRETLHSQLDARVDDELRQEVFELDRLLTDGRDPETGRPFGSLRSVFNVYFARNVPGREEAFLGFVEGELYRSSTLARFPLDRLPTEALDDWETLASRVPGAAESATGRITTPVGDAHFRTARIRFGEDVGAFVVTILPARQRDEIHTLQIYGSGAGLGVILIASVIAWFLAGRVLTPVRLLTETARSISQSDLTQRITTRGMGEADEMARSFNSMLDRLEAVFRRQREFVQDVGHELRDPLTICRGHLELLGDDPGERRATVALVTDELDRMGRIVDDLELLAEADHPDFLRREWIEVETFAHELIAKAGALASRRWDLDDSTGGSFLADRHRLTEVVMNLAHNAVQHTSPDDTIGIGVSLREDVVRVWVRDTGSGVPISDQERIFQRFKRGTDAHRLYRGSGLGLAIAKAIAEAHGGHIELESRLGEGSTFTILFPREPEEGAARGQDPDR